MKIMLNWLCFLGVIAVNALANILPINGYNTGEVSGFYPNAFVPAGFTFSIWGLIYLLLLSYNIAFTFYTIKQDQFKKVYIFVQLVNVQFLITCLLNMAWILAWHYLQIELTVVIMLFFLSTLIQLFLKTKSRVNDLTAIQKLLLHTPFMVYLAWISVATIANITALLVAYHWNGFEISPIYWSTLMICIAVLLAWYILYQYRNLAFALVMIWAIWGIYNGQGPAAPLIAKVAAVGIGFLTTAILFSYFKGFRKNKIA